jgi:hypothetical protein
VLRGCTGVIRASADGQKREEKLTRGSPRRMRRIGSSDCCVPLLDWREPDGGGRISGIGPSMGAVQRNRTLFQKSSDRPDPAGAGAGWKEKIQNKAPFSMRWSQASMQPATNTRRSRARGGVQAIYGGPWPMH